jgi:hypothetical protein
MFKPLSLVLALAIACPSCLLAQAGQEIYDGPAITVFPDHDKLGKQYPIKRAVEDGRKLFATKFNLADGSGRPLATEHIFPTRRSVPGPNFQRIAGPDANSCAGCHNQPRIGGSGDFSSNVFVAAPQFGENLNESINAVFANERFTRSLWGIGGIEIAAREMTHELMAQRDEAQRKARQSGQNVEVKLTAKGVSFGSVILPPDGDLDRVIWRASVQT